jgi:type VI secretion system protein VasI
MLTGLTGAHPVSAADGSETAGAWRITTTASRMDDSPEVSAISEAADAGNTFMSNSPAAILIRCKDQTTELAVITKGFLGLGIAGATTKVTYRIDQNAAVTAQWSLSTNGSSAFYPSSPIRFIRSMPAQGQFLIRLYDSQGSYGEAAFALDGIETVRTAVSGACKWPAPKN